RARGAAAAGDDAHRPRRAGPHGAGAAGGAGDRGRHARALVRVARRRSALEARVQRPLVLTRAMPARYLVGIDLGTTNTACAFVDTRAGRDIQVFQAPQLVAPGQVAPRPTLPSFVYLAGAHDMPAGSLDLPWAQGRDFCVGWLAREQGARVPGRLVSSAKSWLCH